MRRSIFFVARLLAITAIHTVTAVIPSGLAAPDISGFINATIHTSNGGFSVCVSGKVSVGASATNLKLDIGIPNNQTEVTDTWLKFLAPGSTFARKMVTGTHNVSGTFHVGATLCVPANNVAPKEVHLATHGSPFDAEYWVSGLQYRLPQVM